MNRMIETLSHELFDTGRKQTAGDVLFFKLFELFVAASTVHMVWDWGFYILRISDIVLPLGIAQYIDVSFMFGNGLSLVNAGVITLLILAGFMRLNRFAYLIAFLLFHLQFAARYSLGEIPHSSNVVGMTVLGLALAMVLFEDPGHRWRFTLGYTYFFVGLGYTLAAVCKLVGTGPLWPAGRHMWLWIHEKAVDAMGYTGLLEYSPFQRLVLASSVLATALLTFGLLSELFAWLMWWRRFRMPVVLAVLALHVGIYLVMNIMFWHTFFELILLAFPWARWLDAILAARTRFRMPAFVYR